MRVPMCRFKTVSAVLAMASCVLPVMAQAAGHGVQAPQAYFGTGASANSYAPAGIGNLVDNSSMTFAPGAGGSANLSGTMTGSINVQTNIDNSKSIDSSSNISVTKTINGANVGYGLDGGNVLNVIDQNASDAASIQDGIKADEAESLAQALLVAEMQN